MIQRFKDYLLDIRDRQRIAIALAKGGAMMHARTIDLTRPSTWEFSGFSQNGEDGILDVLRRQLREQNRYFVEIGSSDGLENNTAWLVIAEGYSGIMIEGDPALAERARRMVPPFSVGAEVRTQFVTREGAAALSEVVLHSDPDVISLDIDGNDYYVAGALLDAGLRPKIFTVEYNSVYGSERSVTVPYRDDFCFTKAHPSHLYYGVSITAWRKFFAARGYRFVTVDRNGVNGFFADERCFASVFLDGVKGLEFAENRYQYRKFRVPSMRQFELIADQAFIEI